MRAIIRRAQRLNGRLRVPGDKSISHRAVLFGALARGTTRVTGLAPGADVRSSLACVERLGVTVRRSGEQVELESPGRSGWNRAPPPLDAGNSGTTARLLLGMLAPAEELEANVLGDESLSRRPMRRVSERLKEMGADIALSPSGSLPARVRGTRLDGRAHGLDVASAQVKTALLLAGLGSDGETWVSEPGPSRDHTERLLPAFGVELLRGESGVGVRRQELRPSEVPVPGDPSSAAFFAAAALLVPRGEAIIDAVGTNPTRLGIVEALREMGADVAIEEETGAAEPSGRWVCRHGGELRAVVVEGELIPRTLDELPIFAVIAAAARGTTIIREAAELRVKESDRIALMAKGLRAMGARVDELPDGLAIEGGATLRGARIEAGMDHRIAMSFAVAGLIAEGETVIEGAEWADISFPGFFATLARITGGAVRTE